MGDSLQADGTRAHWRACGLADETVNDTGGGRGLPFTQQNQCVQQELPVGDMVNAHTVAKTK